MINPSDWFAATAASSETLGADLFRRPQVSGDAVIPGDVFAVFLQAMSSRMADEPSPVVVPGRIAASAAVLPPPQARTVDSAFAASVADPPPAVAPLSSGAPVPVSWPVREPSVSFPILPVLLGAARALVEEPSGAGSTPPAAGAASPIVDLPPGPTDPALRAPPAVAAGLVDALPWSAVPESDRPESDHDEQAAVGTPPPARVAAGPVTGQKPNGRPIDARGLEPDLDAGSPVGAHLAPVPFTVPTPAPPPFTAPVVSDAQVPPTLASPRGATSEDRTVHEVVVRQVAHDIRGGVDPAADGPAGTVPTQRLPVATRGLAHLEEAEGPADAAEVSAASAAGPVASEVLPLPADRTSATGQNTVTGHETRNLTWRRQELLPSRPAVPAPTVDAAERSAVPADRPGSAPSVTASPQPAGGQFTSALDQDQMTPLSDLAGHEEVEELEDVRPDRKPPSRGDEYRGREDRAPSGTSDFTSVFQHRASPGSRSPVEVTAPEPSPRDVRMVRTPTVRGEVVVPPAPANASHATAAGMQTQEPVIVSTLAADLTTGSDVGGQIVQAARLVWRDGIGEARVTLRPEYLGAVTISLHVEDGGITAVLHVEDPEVAAWVQSNHAALKEGLTERGLTLHRLVVHDERPGSHGRRDGGDGGSREQRRRPRPWTGRGEAPVFEVVV